MYDMYVIYIMQSYSNTLVSMYATNADGCHHFSCFGQRHVCYICLIVNDITLTKQKLWTEYVWWHAIGVWYNNAYCI